MSNYPPSLTLALPNSGPADLVGSLTMTPVAASSGVRSLLTVTAPADTGLTATTEQVDVYLNLAATRTWATGALTTQRFVRVAAPTIAFAAASTVTTAITFDISGAPIAGTNATITNAYAFRVASGKSYFGGAIAMDMTDSSGTPGAVTINKSAGKAAIALGASSVTVTNSRCTLTSIVLVTPISQDATCINLVAVAGTGSFVVSGAANATAATSFAFVVLNPS